MIEGEHWVTRVLRDLLKSHPQQIQELAAKCGLDKRYVSKYFVGRHLPDIRKLEKILKAFNHELEIVSTKIEKDTSMTKLVPPPKPSPPPLLSPSKDTVSEGPIRLVPLINGEVRVILETPSVGRVDLIFTKELAFNIGSKLIAMSGHG